MPIAVQMEKKKTSKRDAPPVKVPKQSMLENHGPPLS